MKTATVIGVGRLGLGLALLLERGGYSVCGIDNRESYVNDLNNKKLVTYEPEYLELLKASDNFRATTNLEEGLNHSDIIIVVVQTPNSGGEKFYDHSILSNLLSSINSYKVSNKHIVIGCTVIPKYIKEVGKFLLSDCWNTTLSYNPEFVAQGNIIKGYKNPDIILIGTESNELANRLREMYSSFIESEPEYCIISPLEAEIVKIGLNGYITTKISFANMISDFCDNVGADKDRVLKSIGNDSRIGTKYFGSGLSFGGPCFPRDTKCLRQIIAGESIPTGILDGTIEYNEYHIDYYVNNYLLQNKHEYIIENICYKEDSYIPIIEESAKLKIAKRLYDHGKKVFIKDKKHLIDEVKKEYGNIFEYEII